MRFYFGTYLRTISTTPLRRSIPAIMMRLTSAHTDAAAKMDSPTVANRMTSGVARQRSQKRNPDSARAKGGA